jgi:ribosomal 30S subunit maturation factor RimM
MEYGFEYTALITDIDEKESLRHGIVFAKNYGDAASKIDTYYDEDLIAFTLYATDSEGGIYEFNYNDTIERVENGKWQEVLIANR